MQRAFLLLFSVYVMINGAQVAANQCDRFVVDQLLEPKYPPFFTDEDIPNVNSKMNELIEAYLHGDKSLKLWGLKFDHENYARDVSEHLAVQTDTLIPGNYSMAELPEIIERLEKRLGQGLMGHNTSSNSFKDRPFVFGFALRDNEVTVFQGFFVDATLIDPHSGAMVNYGMRSNPKVRNFFLTIEDEKGQKRRLQLTSTIDKPIHGGIYFKSK